MPLNRADRQIALLIFALAAAFFARMAAPDMLAGDPGEFQFAAWSFGLAHPTGYPLYLILGGIWQHLLNLIGVSPARALNLFSAVTGGGAVALLFLLLRRWLTGPVLLARAAAILAAVILLVNPTFWSQSLIAEVYTLHALFVLLILYTAQSIEIGAGDAGRAGHRAYFLLALAAGLALSHHGMTLLLFPGLVLYLFLVDRDWWRSSVRWIGITVAFLLPLTLYLYIPLRSGPAASPWYHQRLGDGVLTLYDGSLRAFWNFITGQSISVGFLSLPEALARLGQGGALWRLHFYWPGIVLMIAGLAILIAAKRWPIVAVTLIYVVLQQIFNLFYAIDDILVYYIPIYIMAVIWIGFAAEWMAAGVESGLTAADSPKPKKAASVPAGESELAEAAVAEPAAAELLEIRDTAAVQDADDVEPTAVAEPSPHQMQRYVFSLIVIVVLALLPWRLFNAYRDVVDQSQEDSARRMWEEILAADPPADALFISNDRNEIVPLFYLQTVEERAVDATGLFPLIQPGDQFADIGAVIDRALEDGSPQPVVLLKEMPGLDVKYRVEPLAPPLQQVVGLKTGNPTVSVDEPLGPLTLLGYDLVDNESELSVRLVWQIDSPVAGDYTTTVQLFDGAGEKIAQSDAPPGGLIYPTSLWKPGELLAEEHRLTVSGGDHGGPPHEMLIGMYAGSDLQQLAEPLRLSVVLN